MKKRYLYEIGEEEIVRGLRKRFSARHPRILKAIGDDTSVTLQESSKALLSTVDILLEGTHFRLDYTTPYLLGRKSLSISLSDIASMGGEPLFFLVSIALKPETEIRFLDELYRGIGDCAKEHGAALAGGNTARTGGPAMISTTVFGEAPKNSVIMRKGAAPGDVVYVTGTPGDSALGFKILSEYGPKALRGPFRKAVSRHLDPVPRMEVGRSLRKIATSMIDISDGLALDLKRLCIESGVGASIDAGRLPFSEEMKRYAKTMGTGAALLALTGGEDYELLFTARPETATKIKLMEKKTGVAISPIGLVTGGKKGRIRVKGPDGVELKLERLGYEHF